MKAFLKTAAMGLGVLGASVFSLAGPANAATYINLYGASAQFNFWSNYATAFLASAGGPNCAGGVSGPYLTSDGKSALAIGTGCTGITDAQNAPSGLDNTANKIFFTYSNKASWDGIDAVNDLYDTANNGNVANACSSSLTIHEGTLGNVTWDSNSQRMVAYCGTGGTACGPVNSKNPAGAFNTCEPIYLGTSDVEAAAFTQASQGTLYGPLDANDPVTGGSSYSRAFPANGLDTSNIPASGHYVSAFDTWDKGGKITQPQAPLAYPFSFYVNPSVKAYRCNNAIPAPQTGTDYNGTYCYDDAQCGGAAGSHNLCVSSTIDNLTRLQVVALFSNSIPYWKDFGAAFSEADGNLAVTLCMRHAGSGTSATLDWAVMEGNGWGTQLVQSENRAGSGAPYVYFNDGTGDLQNCMKWANGEALAAVNGGTVDTLDPNEQGGAVGYMDSDNVDTVDYVQVKYDGVRASRMAMHDGIYEYWTINRMYLANNLPQGVVDFYAQMIASINNPINITNATVGGTRGLYYGAANELNFPKATSFTLPYSYAGAKKAANPN